MQVQSKAAHLKTEAATQKTESQSVKRSNVVRVQTPKAGLTAAKYGDASAFCGTTGFALKAANSNLPGEIFLGSSHNDWAVALVGESFVTFQNERGVTQKVLPITSFKGVTAVVSYPDDVVSARLVLEHDDDNWSIFLTKALDGDDFGPAWEAWIEALDLPARLKQRKDEVFSNEGGTVDGSVMPKHKRNPMLVLKPTPRRARSFFRERRPKFLVFRNPGFVG